MSEELGITVKKEDFSEWYTQLLEKAELADVRYNIKGFVVYRSWAQLSIEKMFRIMEDSLQKKEHEPVCFPTLIPEKNFTIEEDHVEGFTADVFWVSTSDSEEMKEKYALRPTSETAFYQMYALWIQGHRDLPLKRYQRANVFRAEKTKSTRPFFRGREFHWIETHCAFSTFEESEKQVIQDMETTKEILYKEFGIPHMFFERPQWDKFPGAEKTFAADALMGSGKVLQLPSTHLLGQKFSKPFNVKFLSKEGKEEFVYSTCYGPSISRIYGAMIAMHGDDKGLKVPFRLAPKQIVIVPIGTEKSENVIIESEKIKKELEEYSVFIDNTDNKPGWKFNKWELKGVPIRIELGMRDIESEQVTIYRRDTDEKKQVARKDLMNEVKKISQEFTENLIKKAESNFEENVVDATTEEEVVKALSEDKIARICLSSIDLDLKEKANEFEKEVGAEIRGVRVDVKETPNSKCVLTGEKAKFVAYIAKSY